MKGKGREIKEIGYTHVLVMNRLYLVIGYARRGKAKKPDKKIVELKCIRQKVKGKWEKISGYSVERPNKPWRIYSDHQFIKCVA